MTFQFRLACLPTKGQSSYRPIWPSITARKTEACVRIGRNIRLRTESEREAMRCCVRNRLKCQGPLRFSAPGVRGASEQSSYRKSDRGTQQFLRLITPAQLRGRSPEIVSRPGFRWFARARPSRCSCAGAETSPEHASTARVERRELGWAERRRNRFRPRS